MLKQSDIGRVVPEIMGSIRVQHWGYEHIWCLMPKSTPLLATSNRFMLPPSWVYILLLFSKPNTTNSTGYLKSRSLVYHWPLPIRIQPPCLHRQLCCILFHYIAVALQEPPNRRIWRSRTWTFSNSTRCTPGHLCLSFQRHSRPPAHKLWCEPRKYLLGSLTHYTSVCLFCSFNRGIMFIPWTGFMLKQNFNFSILMEIITIWRRHMPTLDNRWGIP